MAAGKDIQYLILKEAQNRWLRPAEICEILRNHRSLNIASVPPNKPPSGSMFLFNRKMLRGFRKDGHNWRRNKDRNLMKEGHEKLKAGGIDVLHCYYAHGEENGSFRRRSYWMLDEAYKHIVLVHYLKVKVHVSYKVRKHYRKIFMFVGIVEVILRWRRKGSGFRRFRHEAIIEGIATQNEPSKKDDYDVLWKGQTKERWQRELVMVNSMGQYQEAIDQHRRLLTIAPEFQETKAHVRGHQVRKHYRNILWSVGIVEKVILRWRRKGSGLRGFRLAADIEGTTRIAPSKDDEYDFLTEGRKQTEERLQKALTRVKSMVQYPEARDQYHRLLNVVTEFQEVKVMNDTVLNSSEEAYDNSDAMTIDFGPFLRDNTFMSTIKSLLEFDDSITSSAAMVIHDHSIPSSSSSKKRRFVQKRVLSLPIGDMYGSAMNGEGAPLSDSWAWRKYNQKLVEGSPYLRLYYRCSSSEGCPARKQVERSKEDPTMIVLTYAYEHNHPSPASRNFNPTSTAAPTTTNNNTTSTAPNKLLPEEPAVFFNQPKIQPDKKFVNLGDESLINTNDCGWFSEVASTSSAVLERPIFLGSTNELEADMASKLFRIKKKKKTEDKLINYLEIA